MAISIDGFCVVVRVRALDERFPGGLAGFLAMGNGVTACSDGTLARIAFMAHEDMTHAGARLDELGLGPSPERAADWVEVSAARGPDPSCRWLEFGRYAGCSAVWLRGTNPEPLVVPPHWTHRHALHNNIDRSKLRFVERKDGVEEWVHVDTGESYYIARRDDAETRDAAEQARIDALFHEAGKLLGPYLDRMNNSNPQLGLLARWRVKRGVRKYERVVEAAPEHAAAHWLIGVSHRLLGDRERSYQGFRHAYLLRPDHADVAREYVLQCMATERASEAVRAAERICALYPNDVGLLANFGLTLLVAGNVERALTVTRQALERDPDDEITLMLVRMIEDVAAGRRPRPTRYPP